MDDTQLFRTIGAISRQSTTSANQQVKPYGLDNNLFQYLMRIVENEGITQVELTNLIKVDKTTLSRALQKLERHGYLVKVPNPANKKYKLLYPTDSGREVYNQLYQVEQGIIKQALGQLTPSDRIQLATLLQKISASL